MSLARSLTSSMVVLAGGRVLSILLALVTVAMLTRALGPEDFGYFRTAIAYLSLAMLIGGFGLNTVVVRELARAEADQPRILGNALALRLTLSATAITVGCLLAWLLPFDLDARACILAGSFGFACYAAHMMLAGFFQQRLRQTGSVLAEITGAALLLAAVAWLRRNGAPVVDFVLAQAVAYVAMLAVSWVAAWRLTPFRLRAEPPVWRRLFGRALPLAGVDWLNLVYSRSDTLLLALWGTAASVGLYGVAAKIYDTFLGISMLFVGMVGPILGRRAHVDPEGFRSFLATGWTLLMAGVVGIGLMLWSFAPEFMSIIAGSEFVAGAAALRVFSLLIVVGPSRVLFRDVTTMLDLQHRLLPGSIIGAVVGLAAYAVLIPRFGAVGAGCALLLAELTVCIQAALVLIGAGATRLAFRAPLLAIGCGLLAAWAIELLRGFGLPWPLLAVLGGLGYLALLVLTGVLQPRAWLQLVVERPAAAGLAGGPQP